MKRLDGKKIADERAALIQKRIKALGFVPTLVIVRVGDRADSKSYVRRKVQYAEMVGANAIVSEHPAEITEQELLDVVDRFNTDQNVYGIIVQLPLPGHIDAKAVIDRILPQKDVDGLGDHNIAKLAGGEPGVVPATPRGILTLLQDYDIDVAGAYVVVLGRSRLVGKSAALLMLNHDATVTICHSKTRDLPSVTRAADILIVAVGRQRFITAEYLRDGQVVIDVGIGADEDGKLAGDVDRASVESMDIMLSPVPGGVGPMTVASLFENLIDVAAQEGN